MPTTRFVGFTMIGSEAGEVMAVVQTAMLAKLPYQRLRDAVIAHLTWPRDSARCFRTHRRHSGSSFAKEKVHDQL